MINILSYVGMNMQSEVCLWCLLGLVRTIFDATLFKVNANLKQVWQMTMPAELSMPVQRVLRTMVSGIMLVQCFTVYVYLAAYIVLLYPVFLEERPTLVLPWLLLAAIRKLLCELTSLALGLGTCVLLGPARPPCIKFVVVKFTSILPAFYMWMLVFSYYHALKVASAFKTFPAVLPPNDNDYGLELAVRRRRTKSLLGEEQLRKKLVANFYGERSSSITNETYLQPVMEISSRMVHSTDTSLEEAVPETDVMKPLTMSTTGWSDIGAYEDWFGSEVMIPRDTDRILEQIVLMLLRIGAYLKKEGIESIIDSQILNSAVPPTWHQRDNIDCAAINADDTDTPPLVGSSKGNTASYLREYPQIFMKKQGTDIPQTELTIASLKTVHSHVESEEGNINNNKMKHPTSDTSIESIAVEVEKVPSKKKITISNKVKHEDTPDKLTMPRPLKSKQLAITEGKKLKTKRNKPLDLESQSKENVSETLNKVKKNEDVKKKNSNSKILNENNSNELPQSELSTNAKTINTTDTNILKKDKNNEVIQSKIASHSTTQHSINSKILEEDKYEEPIHSKIQDNNNEFVQSKIQTDAKPQYTTSNDTLNHKKNEESLRKLKHESNNIDIMLKEDSTKDLTRNKISSNAESLNSKHSKTLQKVKNEENDSKTLKEDNNNKFTQSIISTDATAQVSKDKIWKEDKNEESLDSKLLKQNDNDELSQSKITTQNSRNSYTLDENKHTESTDTKILKQDNDFELKQSEISTSAKTLNSTDSKIMTQDKDSKYIQSKTPTNVKTQHTTSSKTLNKDKTEESMDSKILKQDNYNEFTQSKITTNTIAQVSKDSNILDGSMNNESLDSKFLKLDNNSELTQSRISTDFKTKSSLDSKINNEFTQNNKPSTDTTEHLFSNTLNEDNNKESMSSKILKPENHLKVKQSKMSTSANTQNSSDSQIITKDINDEMIQSEISTNAISKHTKISKTLNEDKEEESMDSFNSSISILKQDHNKDFTQSKITTYAVAQVTKESEIISEDKNTKSMDSKLLNQGNSYEFTHSKISTQNSVDGRVIKQDNSKELVNSKLKTDAETENSIDTKISNENKDKEFSNSNISYERKTKEFIQSEMSNQFKGKEFPQSKLHIDSNQSLTNSKIYNVDNSKELQNREMLNKGKREEITQNILHSSNEQSSTSKVSNVDNNKESTEANVWIEDKFKEFTNSILFSGAENQESTENKILPSDDNDESCSCSDLNIEQNSNETENNDVKTPGDQAK